MACGEHRPHFDAEHLHQNSGYVGLPNIKTLTDVHGWAPMSGSGCQRSTSTPSGRCLCVCACATVESRLEESHGANDLDSQAHGREKARGGWNGLYLRAPVSGV